jgi:hypothetical protein
MWHKIEAWAREHPAMLGIGIFIVGAIIVYLFARGSSAPAPQQGQDLSAYYGAQAAAAQAGNAFQSQQVAAQAAVSQAQLALQAVHERVAGDIALGTIDSQTQLGVAGLQAGVMTGQTAADLQLGTLQSTLSANMVQAGYDRDIQAATLQYGAATEQARIASATALGTAAYGAQTAEAGFLAQVQQVAIQGATTLGVAAQSTTLGTNQAIAARDAAVGVATQAQQLGTNQAAYATQLGASQALYASMAAQGVAMYASQTGIANALYGGQARIAEALYN